MVGIYLFCWKSINVWNRGLRERGGDILTFPREILHKGSKSHREIAWYNREFSEVVLFIIVKGLTYPIGKRVRYWDMEYGNLAYKGVVHIFNPSQYPFTNLISRTSKRADQPRCRYMVQFGLKAHQFNNGICRTSFAFEKVFCIPLLNLICISTT